MINMKSNVINKIVKNDLCIGCGICVGLCPHKILEIHDNNYGEYIPSETQECNYNCGLCLKVCPFNDNDNETQIAEKIYGHIEGIKYMSETGYYIDSFVGYSSEFRQSSASGGMTTWLLTELLRENIVDYIVCPVNQKNPERIFDFKTFACKDSLRDASGSVYYPLEMSEIIKKILETPGRYAITGLPCFLKALRLASQRNRKLEERIVFTIGLVCGQIKSKHYTEYIAALASGGKAGKIQSVHYREKNPDRPVSNYYYKIIDENGSQYKICWNDGISEAWVNRWFTPNACNYCDDIFAELADITFMDAWLPEYSNDDKGTNLLIIRSPEILTFIHDKLRKSEIVTSRISIEKVVQSQAGVIRFKREQLSYRLYVAAQKIPKKRFHANKDISLLEKQEVKIKNRMQKESKKLFYECRQNNKWNIVDFRRAMKPYIQQINQLILIRKLLTPMNIIKRITKIRKLKNER